MEAKEWIEQLNMQKHPEGGYFYQSFATQETVLLDSHPGERKLYTSIYFLLESGDASHFHRLKSDELWYFHTGSALTIHIISPAGVYRTETLGLDIRHGESPQVLVEKGSIFGSTVNEADAFSLVGCMVAPGFEFEDFELFERTELLARFKEHEPIIRRLTKTKRMLHED